MTTTKTAARKSVPLSQHDLDVVQRVREAGSSEARAFQLLTGATPDAPLSEAEVVRAMVHIGCTVLAEKELELAYEREAAFMAEDPECQEWVRVMRARLTGAFTVDEEDMAA